MIDHINQNPLDNRKINLREVEKSINATNAKKRTDGSQEFIRGVHYNKPGPKNPKGSYTAQWSINKKRFTKVFSINKYGEEEAKRLATEYRLEKLKEMKI